MPFVEPFRASCFEKQYNYLLNGKFPQSKNSVEKIVKDVINNPLQGDRFPGFGQNTHIRKLRIGLKEHRISKRDGLRLIWMLSEEKKWVLMVAIYHKSDYKNEKAIQGMIKENFRSLLEYLPPQQVGPPLN